MDKEIENLTKIIIKEAAQGKSLEELLSSTLPLEPVPSLILSKIGDMSISKLGSEIGLSNAGIYKIINGKIRPERDILLRIAFTLHMSVTETQQLLKSGHRSCLTGGEPRDIALIYGLTKGMSLDRMEEELRQYNFKLLM